MAQAWESIASDCEDCSFSSFFKLLRADTVSRIADKFSSFRSDRVKIHSRMESYVRDYESHGGGATRRYEALEEEYTEGAPDLSHLVLRDDGSASSALWSMKDMAIILGRNVSNVLRTIRKMYDHPKWGVILAEHEFKREKNGREAVTLYDSGVFDVIVDFFESIYLERFTSPRRGESMTDLERKTVYSLWDYLKTNPGAAEKLGTNHLIEGVRAYGMNRERVYATLYQNLRGIVKRAFSIKPGTFFLLLFALIYELSKKYLVLNLVVPAVSATLLISVLLMMNRRKFINSWLTDIGACAVTLSLLWALAMVASPDGPAAKLLPESVARKEVDQVSAQDIDSAGYANRLEDIETEITSQNEALEANAKKREVPAVKVDYSRSGGGNGKIDVWIHTGPQTKEILYRTSPNDDFRSTGFSDHSGANGALRPLRTVTLDPESAENLWIKYIDDNGMTHGPYEINFDYRAERMKEARRMLDKDIKWVDFSKDENGASVFTNVVTGLGDSLNDLDIVERVMYGVNRRTPNVERVFSADIGTEGDLPGSLKRKLQSSLISDSKEKIWFVSMKIIFKDGSESDVRIFDNPYAEQE
jgi:hypothetical protein